MLGLLYYSTKSNIFGEEEGFICGSIEMVSVWKVHLDQSPLPLFLEAFVSTDVDTTIAISAITMKIRMDYFFEDGAKKVKSS